MRNYSRQSRQAQTEPTLRERAAQTRDAAGRFFRRTAGEVTNQPQPASLPEGSTAERRDGDFPASGAVTHDARRGRPADLSRAAAAFGRAPRREHDMGRHETFGNATPITDELLASTMLAGARTVASNDPARDSTSTLALIAEHRLARNRWDDTLKPADKVWRKQHGLDTSTEAVALAEAERDAADDAVTKAWNELFSAPPASSAELLALLRHAQQFVDEDHAPDAAIELSGMVRAIGDAVETLRSQPQPEFGTENGATSPDRFLTDLAPTLLPLLNEADAEWAKVHALYEQAEAACGKGPVPGSSEVAYRAYQGQFDVALVATGYKAAWEAIQPLFERIEALVGPLMNVPVQTLEGLILKQRIGQTLSHFEDDAAKDLAKLATAYRPGEATGQGYRGLLAEEPSSLFDRDFSRDAFDYAWGLDLSPVPFDNLLRLYDVFGRTADALSDAAQEKQFWVQPSCGRLTAGGIVVDAEQNRLACLRDACAAELQRRRPQTERDRDAALVLRLTHEMLCEAKIRDRSLIVEISKAWGG